MLCLAGPGWMTLPQVNHHRPLPAPDDLHCPGEASVPPLVFPTSSYGQAGSGVSETWACFDSPPEVSAARAQPALSGPFVGDDLQARAQARARARAGQRPHYLFWFTFHPAGRPSLPVRRAPCAIGARVLECAPFARLRSLETCALRSSTDKRARLLTTWRQRGRRYSARRHA